MNAFYSRDEKCLQRGTDWVFKYSGLRLVFKGLIARHSCKVLMKLKLSRQIFEKLSRIKFRKNPFFGRRVVSCGQKDKRTDMKKLTVTFLNFVKEPKGDKT
jgi:hypothetical protein